MLPLYIKDDIQIPYFVVSCLFLGFSYVFVQRDIGLMAYSDFKRKSLFISVNFDLFKNLITNY